MKTLTSITLALLLGLTQLQGQTSTNAPPAKPPGNDAIHLPCLIILACALVAGAVVIYVYSTDCNACLGKKLVLEQWDYATGTWKPVATNTSLTCTNRWDAFVDYSKDVAARYRVRIDQ